MEYTLFELMYGHQANLLTTLIKSRPTYNYDDYAQELREKLISNTTQVPLTESNETLHTGRILKKIRHVFFIPAQTHF